MKPYIENTELKGEKCLLMHTDRYSALFAPTIGANMLRLRDEQNDYEILHFDENADLERIKSNICLYGIPSLYLPNRFHKGIIKTSDSKYTLPINEPMFDNFIHGWIHQRAFEIINQFSNDDYCTVCAQYRFDCKDEYYESFPLDFTVTITYTLSDNGLEYTIQINNLSTKMLPVVAGCHTAMNLHFCKQSADSDIRLRANAVKRGTLNKHLCSTGKFEKLNDFDLSFKNGTINPLDTSIDNCLYIIESMKREDRDFYGVEIFDDRLKKGILYEAGEEYKFWLFWNHWAQIGICCPEPMSALIDSPNIPLDNNITGYREIAPMESWIGRQRISTY